MIISWEKLSIQPSLVPLCHLKIIAGEFKPQGKVGDSSWVALLIVFLGAPSFCQRGQWFLNQILHAHFSFQVTPQHLWLLHSKELSLGTATSVPAGDTMTFCWFIKNLPFYGSCVFSGVWSCGQYNHNLSPC